MRFWPFGVQLGFSSGVDPIENRGKKKMTKFSPLNVF